LKNDDKNRQTNCEPPLPNSSFPKSLEDSSETPIVSSDYVKDATDSVTIECDIFVKAPFEGDIKDLIAIRMKDIMEVAEEDPNAYSYEESEMKYL